jgi:hypothetical protein
MTTIEELLWPDTRLRQFASKPETDPLTEDDALQEAQLLGVRIGSFGPDEGAAPVVPAVDAALIPVLSSLAEPKVPWRMAWRSSG